MPELAPFPRPKRIRLQAKHRSLDWIPEASPGRFHVLTTTSPATHLAVTGLTLLRDAGHSPTRKRALVTRKNGPERLQSGPFAMLAAHAAICLANGAVVLISILRGKAAAATGAVISNTPFTYSAVSFSTFTPSGSVRVLSNTP
jgi:hypothetical protein